MKVCIISEGSYPMLPGGLSEWAHMLIKNLKDVEFEIFCIVPFEEARPWVYERLPNINQVVVKSIIRTYTPRFSRSWPKSVSAGVVKFLNNGNAGLPWDLEELVKAINYRPVNKGWLNSPAYWEFVTDSYEKLNNGGPFTDFFWQSYGIHQILMDSLHFIKEIPKADIYHCVSTGFAGFTGALAQNTFKRPLVITEQGLYLLERKNELARQNLPEWYEKLIMNITVSMVKTSYKYADMLVPPCHSHLAMEKELGADLNKVMVINNGIELDRFRPSSQKREIPVIGCFARVVPVKGITFLIEAARIVCNRYPVDFVVLGDTSDKEYVIECEKKIKELGLEDRFRFMGHVNPTDWYPKVDIFTLSSLSEGVPYALLEAMSCGIPAVCTAVGGVPEIIANEAGFVVPPGRPDLLAEKYIKLLDDKELRQKMGRRATELAAQKYDIKQMGQSFYNLYEGLIKDYGKH